MLKNGKVTVFAVSDLFREKEQASKFIPPHPPLPNGLNCIFVLENVIVYVSEIKKISNICLWPVLCLCEYYYMNIFVNIIVYLDFHEIFTDSLKLIEV